VRSIDTGAELLTAERRCDADVRRVEQFVEAALRYKFETRYEGESRWWPTSIYELAQTLARYKADPVSLLEKMLDGAELVTAISRFRVASDDGRTGGPTALDQAA
jgi:hypothetical protein